MKREILFRAKRVDSGEWVFGYLVKDPKENYRIYYQPFSGASSNTYHIVLPETVCQFTGLTDKNGVKIFEGDIIKYTEHSNYLLKSFIADVSYKDYLASFSYLKHGLDDNGFEQPLIHFFNEVDEFEEDMLPYIEVIGNIHDNPELINN
jgi:uncharacterized phage protein (TIGR01671 family)